MDSAAVEAHKVRVFMKEFDNFFCDLDKDGLKKENWHNINQHNINQQKSRTDEVG